LHSTALSSNGDVYIWGDNQDNCLGIAPADANFPQVFTPLQGKSITQVACGFRHTFALSSTGELYAWGYDRHDVLGAVTQSPYCLVRAVEGKSIQKVVSGGMFAVALSADGKLYSWGEGRDYKTCQPTEQDSKPQLIKAMSAYVVNDVACGSAGAIAFYEEFSEARSSLVHLDEGFENFRAVVSKPKIQNPKHQFQTKLIIFFQVNQINDQVRQVEQISEILKVVNQIRSGGVRKT
jgi:hypothetical protein